MLVPLLLSGLVVFFTHALEAVTGFGCSVLAMPFVTALLGMRQGVMVITILAWFLAAYMAISKRKQINFRQFGVIAGFMLLGLPLGMFLFRAVNTGILKKILAVFIIAVSVSQLALNILFRNRTSEPVRGLKNLPYYLLLIIGGIVHGIFSTGGPLVVIYASRALPEKGQFRATLCLLWTVLNTVIIITYFVEGSMTTEIAANTGILLPFVALGIVAGETIHHRLNARIFTIMVFNILLVTGCIMLFL